MFSFLFLLSLLLTLIIWIFLVVNIYEVWHADEMMLGKWSC